MNNAVIKSLLINNVIELIAKKQSLSLDKARDIFYESNTLKLLEDMSTGLYGCSALYIYSLFLKEQKNK